MQVVADIVISNLYSGVGQKSGKTYFVIECVVVGCQELPILSGVALKKFISEDVYNDFGNLTCDRCDCSIGISRAPVNGRECDLGFNLFINGLPKDVDEEIEKVSTPASPASPAVPGDKEKNKGGKS